MTFVNFGKMVQHGHTLLFILLIHTCANAAPSASDESEKLIKLEHIPKAKTDVTKTHIPITLDEATTEEKNNAQGQRQKRYYNYGFPPMSPVIYPGFPPNDPYPNNYNQDPFQHIYRRLQDIAGVIRNPNYNAPPPPPPIPIFFPVLFIPQTGCQCTPNQGNVPKPVQNDTVDVTNRFPDMEDPNQNWGIVVNQNETEVDDGMPEDFTRPISFVPIRPNRTMSRPPPAVDHGSNQEGRESQTTTTTAAPPTPPTVCDAAVLSCCHQAEVSYECFVVQGCPDTSAYQGNPCTPQVILQVVNRFSRYYGQRAG